MESTEKTIRVWDPIVRIGHWTLVLTFFTAYFTEDEWLTQHVWAGYVLAAVVCLRLVWGLIGSKHARFSDFVRSPKTILAYVRDLVAHRARRYVGHNPAGGAMIVALLLGLSMTSYSGLMLYAIEEGAGPLAGWVANDTASSGRLAPISPALADEAEAEEPGEEGRVHRNADDPREEFWEEVHEFFANFTLLLIVLHIAGVVHASFAQRENLVRAMFTGRKRG